MESRQVVATFLVLLGVAALAGYGWLGQQPWSSGSDCSEAPGALADLCRGDAAMSSGALTTLLLLVAVMGVFIGASIFLAESLRSY